MAGTLCAVRPALKACRTKVNACTNQQQGLHCARHLLQGSSCQSIGLPACATQDYQGVFAVLWFMQAFSGSATSTEGANTAAGGLQVLSTHGMSSPASCMQQVYSPAVGAAAAQALSIPAVGAASAQVFSIPAVATAGAQAFSSPAVGAAGAQACSSPAMGAAHQLDGGLNPPPTQQHSIDAGSGKADEEGRCLVHAAAVPWHRFSCQHHVILALTTHTRTTLVRVACCVALGTHDRRHGRHVPAVPVCSSNIALP
jgi:hypothetical protein